MAQTEKELVDKITKYIFEKKGAHGEWFIGISSDPQKALFKAHNVDKKTDFWMYEFLPDALSAHRAVDQLLMMSQGKVQALGPKEEVLSRVLQRPLTAPRPLKVVPDSGSAGA